MTKITRPQTLGEEIANAVSHGIGAGLSIAGMIILIVTACVNNLGAMAIVSAVLYGTGLILLYTFSSIYHSLTHEKAKFVFRVFDHCSIFPGMGGNQPGSGMAYSHPALLRLCLIATN